MKKTVIVTGASSGVGYAVCELLSHHNYNVIGLSRTTKKISSLIKKNNNVEHYGVDLVSYKETARVFKDILEKHRKIDLLVNAAALFESRTFATQDIHKIHDIVDVNIKTYLNTIKLVLDNMISFKSGQIINISSVSGKKGIENQAVYSSTKFALRGLGDSLGQELASHNIRITTLYPGGIDTELWNSQNPYGGDKTQLLKPPQVADIILFVASLEPNIVMKEMVFYPINEIH